MRVNYIDTRLGMAFGCLIAILVAVGWLGLGHMSKANRTIEKMWTHEWSKVQLSRQALRYSTRNNSMTMQVFLIKSRTEIEALLIERAKNSDRISELLKQIQAQVESDEEQELLDNVLNTRKPYVESYTEALNLLLNQVKEEESQLTMANLTLPRLLKYHGAWDKFVEFQVGQMDKVRDTINDDFSMACHKVFGLLVIGTILGIVVALFVTRQLSAGHEELQRSEQRFRHLSASAPIGIFLIDTNRRGLYTNPRWRSITGLSEMDSLGVGWKQAIHPDDALVVEAEFDDSERTGRDFAREFRFRNAAGEVRWVHSLVTALRSEANEVTGYVGTIEDVTERKRAEAILAGVQKELVESSRQAGMAELAAGVLHNVGNVLNSVNVASTCISKNIRKSKACNLSKVVALLREHESDMATFWTNDPKGKRIPDYLAQLSECLMTEQEAALNELALLQKNVEHIKNIVSVQQSGAKGISAVETFKVADLVEDALRMNSNAFLSHEILIVKDFNHHLEVTA